MSSQADYISAFIRLSTPPPPQRFEIRPEIRVHFYSSEAPCLLSHLTPAKIEERKKGITNGLI